MCRVQDRRDACYRGSASTFPVVSVQHTLSLKNKLCAVGDLGFGSSRDARGEPCGGPQATAVTEPKTLDNMAAPSADAAGDRPGSLGGQYEKLLATVGNLQGDLQRTVGVCQVRVYAWRVQMRYDTFVRF